MRYPKALPRDQDKENNLGEVIVAPHPWWLLQEFFRPWAHERAARAAKFPVVFLSLISAPGLPGHADEVAATVQEWDRQRSLPHDLEKHAENGDLECMPRADHVQDTPLTVR